METHKVEPLTLGPPKGPLALGIAFGVVGCALGIGFAAEGAGLRVFGVVLAVVGALLALALLSLLRPGAAYLRVDAVGVAYKWGPRSAAYAWANIASFEVAPMGKNAWGVGIRLRPGHANADGAKPGVDDTFSSYTMTPDALVALLEERRRAAEARASQLSRVDGMSRRQMVAGAANGSPFHRLE